MAGVIVTFLCKKYVCIPSPHTGSQCESKSHIVASIKTIIRDMFHISLTWSDKACFCYLHTWSQDERPPTKRPPTNRPPSFDRRPKDRHSQKTATVKRPPTKRPPTRPLGSWGGLAGRQARGVRWAEPPNRPKERRWPWLLAPVW